MRPIRSEGAVRATPNRTSQGVDRVLASHRFTASRLSPPFELTRASLAPREQILHVERRAANVVRGEANGVADGRRRPWCVSVPGPALPDEACVLERLVEVEERLGRA